jgi:hypothetical protein
MPMLRAMTLASALVMVFSESAAKWERILVAIVVLFGTVIGAVALRRRRRASTEIGRESMTILTLVLVLFAFVIAAAFVLLLWALAPGLGG